MSLRQHLRQLLRSIVFSDPLPVLTGRGMVAVKQLPTVLAATFVVVLFLVADAATALANGWLWVGTLCIVSATGAAFLLPWTRWPSAASLVVPVVDLVAFGLIAATGSGTLTGISTLLALPLLWLAWSRQGRGLVLAASFFLPLAVVWCQAAHLGRGLTFQTMLQPVLVPAVLFAFTLTVAVLSTSVEASKGRTLEALKSVQKNAQLLNGILDTVNVGVVVVDEQGNEVMMNRTQWAVHESLLPPGAATSDEAGLLLFGPDRKTPLPPDERSVRRAVLGDEFSGQLVWGGREGKLRAYSASARTLRDDTGETVGAVIAFHDITDLMHALDAKDDFFSTVNHELRTPLTSIIGYLEMAVEAPHLDPAIAAYLRVAERNAERLLDLVGDLLDAAAGKINVVMDAVDFSAVVEATLPQHASQAARRHIDFRSSITGGLLLRGDERRLGQILDNLLSNAIKYSPAGGAIDVTLKRAGNGTVQFSVSDNGPGMTDAEQKSLFTRFYRAEEVRRTAIPGAGLGLPITKDLAEDHGGTITVQSQPGLGSTFTVTFPHLR